MRTVDTVKTAVTGLGHNKLRTVLTVLGIVIGVAAIVLVFSLGRSAESLILRQIEGLGAKTVVVLPGQVPRGPAYIATSLLSDRLREPELEILRNPSLVPGARLVEPAVFGSFAVAAGTESVTPLVFGFGQQAMTDIFDLSAGTGRLLSADDVRDQASVAVIGATVRDELFGESDVIGQTIRIENQRFRVVGVLQQSGELGFFNPDELVALPYTTMQDRLGPKFFNRIFIQAESSAAVAQVAEDARLTLRDLHRIDNPDNDDFFVLTQSDIIDRVAVVTQTLSLFLVLVAAVSLLVGGVGIMNVMLVAVTQRTFEIGLRKTVGATGRDIAQQFLLEAVFLTGSGGVLGTVLALLISGTLALGLQVALGGSWEWEFSLAAVLLGVGMAVVVGLVFGIYPALRAARLSPLEALRKE